MALLAWDQNFSVNFEQLDNQHRKLIGMVNELHAAMKAGSVREILKPLLDKLVEYTRTHFIAEEKLMLIHHYPGFAQHRKEHEEFIRQIDDFQQKYAAGNVLLTLEVMGFLVNWVRDHIQLADKKYSPFLNNRTED